MGQRRRYTYQPPKIGFGVQLTSMVDMFTILLVFLLKSFSTSAVHVTPAKDLHLPVSSSTVSAEDAVKVIVSTKGILVDEVKVADMADGKILPAFVDDKDNDFVRPLYDELEKAWAKKENVEGEASGNKDKGKIVMQADSSLPYQTLRKVMYTASMSGFVDVKLATLSPE